MRGLARVQRLATRIVGRPKPLPQPDSPFHHYNSSFDALGVIRRAAVDEPDPDPRYLTNFLGVRIDPSYLPGVLDGKAGQVEPPPIPANWHADIAEWSSALRSVEQAEGNYRIVELGCGWGCWLNNTGAAAVRRGLRVDLIGVEGDPRYVEFARESLSANGFEPSQYRIIHGIAAARTGTALFPATNLSGADWGLAPILDASPAEIEQATASGTHYLLEAFSFADLVVNQPVDLLHIDIQGGEYGFIRDCLGDIGRLVRRILVGTHSRQIEGQIMELLLSAGWGLEMERPAIFAIDDPRSPRTTVDGVQLWVNPSMVR